MDKILNLGSDILKGMAIFGFIALAMLIAGITMIHEKYGLYPFVAVFGLILVLYVKSSNKHNAIWFYRFLSNGKYEIIKMKPYNEFLKDGIRLHPDGTTSDPACYWQPATDKCDLGFDWNLNKYREVEIYAGDELIRTGSYIATPKGKIMFHTDKVAFLLKDDGTVRTTIAGFNTGAITWKKTNVYIDTETEVGLFDEE